MSSGYYCEIDGCDKDADYECYSTDLDGESGSMFCCADHKKTALVMMGVDEYYAGLRVKELANQHGGNR